MSEGRRSFVLSHFGILALLAHLPRAAALADGKEQRSGITVDHGKATGRSHYLITPVLGSLEHPLQTGALLTNLLPVPQDKQHLRRQKNLPALLG